MRAPKELAIMCGQLSEQVYDECVAVDDLGYSITELPELVVVAFRGTANKRNVLRDINVVPWKGSGPFMTTWGFARAYSKLKKPVLKDLPKNKPVVFTGHSLGGAIAILFAEHLGSSAITFGAPRIYSRLSFWFTSKINHTRITMDDDPVAMIPKFGYYHAHERVNLLDEDSDTSFIDIEDHSISEYNKFMNQYK